MLAEDSDDDSFRIATIKEVDELLSRSSDTESAFQLQDGFINTLATAGFESHTWKSDDTKLVERLPGHYREAADKMIMTSDEYVIKSLGIKRNPVPDHFCLTVNLTEQSPVIKRQILSSHETL